MFDTIDSVQTGEWSPDSTPEKMFCVERTDTNGATSFSSRSF
jgi:hypothetical protein